MSQEGISKTEKNATLSKAVIAMQMARVYEELGITGKETAESLKIKAEESIHELSTKLTDEEADELIEKYSKEAGIHPSEFEEDKKYVAALIQTIITGRATAEAIKNLEIK